MLAIRAYRMTYVSGSVYLILGVCCMMFYNVCSSPGTYVATTRKVETVSLLNNAALSSPE